MQQQISKVILRKMNKAIGNTLPDFKINYNSLAIKTEWY